MNSKEIILSDLAELDTKKSELEIITQEMEENPKFAQFLKARKDFQEMESQIWRRVENVMIENDIRQIKTDSLTLTIAKRISFDIDEEVLADKYFKRVPNTSLIAGTFKLEGEPVNGTTPKYTQYLTKRVK
jgi:hypothetical protein